MRLLDRGANRSLVIALVAISLLALSCVQPAQPPPTATPPPPPPAKPVATTAPQPAKPAAEATKPVAKDAAKPTPRSKDVALAPLSPPVKVKYGNPGRDSASAVYVALEKGYFKEQGLDLELTPFDASGSVIPPLAAGQLDSANAAVTAALFNAVARGISVSAVADSGRNATGHEYNTLAVRRDVAERVKDFKDLKGLKIAIVSKNGPGYVQIAKALAKGGLSLKDADIVTMPFPDMLAAFANKAIDAGILSEPFATQGAEQGLFVNWKSAHPDFYPNHQVGVVMFAPNFTQRQPEAAKRFIIAYIKGIRAYVDGFDRNVGLDEIISILMKHTPLKDPAVYRKVRSPGFDRNGYIFTQHLIDDQNFYVEQGLIKPDERADVSKLVDNSYVEYALSILGKQ
ncbi:MAG: ABC transporter substrate-binding protein [Chloroflexi bacterium]|nr:ABC transporter substrate-binding protein [Chloroflexota bacterium]